MVHCCSDDGGSCAELDDGSLFLVLNGAQSSFTRAVKHCPFCGESAGSGGQTMMVSPRHDVLPWEDTNDW